MPLFDPKLPKDPTVHYILRCRCGVVLQQCRCMGPHVEIVSDAPCTHTTSGLGLATSTTAPQVSWLAILGGLGLIGVAGLMFFGASNMDQN